MYCVPQCVVVVVKLSNSLPKHILTKLSVSLYESIKSDWIVGWYLAFVFKMRHAYQNYQSTKWRKIKMQLNSFNILIAISGKLELLLNYIEWNRCWSTFGSNEPTFRTPFSALWNRKEAYTTMTRGDRKERKQKWFDMYKGMEQNDTITATTAPYRFCLKCKKTFNNIPWNL